MGDKVIEHFNRCLSVFQQGYEQALLTYFSDTERNQFSEFIDRL
jgi:hypothetical protein